MKEIVSILIVGVSLSMDTFSLSLSIGSIYKKNPYLMCAPLVVGSFHFFMPLLGNLLGIGLISFLSLTSSKLLGFILLALGLNLAYHYFKDEKITLNLSLTGILLFALSVSLDSFSVGIGISALTSNYIIASIIFAVCSSSFTYLGLIIGKYFSKVLGRYANLIGIILLILLGIIHLFK